MILILKVFGQLCLNKQCRQRLAAAESRSTMFAPSEISTGSQTGMFNLEIICMKCQNLTSGENKQIIPKCRLLKLLTQSAISREKSPLLYGERETSD